MIYIALILVLLGMILNQYNHFNIHFIIDFLTLIKNILRLY